MKTADILQQIVDVHNRIIQIPVSGEGTLMMADAIMELRRLAQALKNDVDQSGEKAAVEVKDG